MKSLFFIFLVFFSCKITLYTLIKLFILVDNYMFQQACEKYIKNIEIDKAGVTQLVEWLPSKQYVVGSNPITRSLKNMKKYTWKVLYKGRKPIGLVYSISSWNAEKIAIEKFSKIYKKEDIWIEKQISQNNSVGRVAVL